MLDLGALKRRIKETEGIIVPESELQEIAQSIARGVIEAEEEARYEFVEWAGESLGIFTTEQEVRDHFNLGPDDKAYFGYIDGKLVYFQYHAPFEGGMRRLNKDNIDEIMASHKARLVETSANARVATEITKAVITRREG